MRVGIDFGTTHTVAAAVDKGNYPVVSFDGVDGWPSMIAANADGELRFGAHAAAVRHAPGWTVLRSFKRLLNDAGLAPGEAVEAAISVPVGGTGSFPLVSRMLRAAFGEDIVFDPIVPKDASLPADGRSPLVVRRTYRAAHNIGHFRFVECSRLIDGRPDGDVTPYAPVLFPFDPALRDRGDLGLQTVGRCSDGPEVEEQYVVAPSGAVEVTVTTQPAGFQPAFQRTFRLERRVAVPHAAV